MTPTAAPPIELRALRRSLRNVALLALAAPVVSALAGRDLQFTTGVALGGLVAALNFLAIARIAARIVRGTLRVQALLMIALVVKMTLLMAVVFVVIHTFEIHPVGFVIGLSALVAGLALEGLRLAFVEERA